MNSTLPLQIRLMTQEDIPLGRHLVATAGWNQLESDWLRMLSLEPEGCFVAEYEGKGAGTTTCISFGDTGWIAMVLVDPEVRGKGIARELMKTAIDYFDRKGVMSICLDATPMGEKVYRKLGFEGTYEVIRFKREAGVDGTPEPRDLIKVSSDDPRMDEVCRLDETATGAARDRFLKILRISEAYCCNLYTSQGGLQGYAAVRDGRNAVQLGPVIAKTHEAGIGLLSELLVGFQHRPCFLDVPVPNHAAVEWAQSHGFVSQRQFLRMYRGVRPMDRPEWIWASSGPEKG